MNSVLLQSWTSCEKLEAKGQCILDGIVEYVKQEAPDVMCHEAGPLNVTCLNRESKHSIFNYYSVGPVFLGAMHMQLEPGSCQPNSPVLSLDWTWTCDYVCTCQQYEMLSSCFFVPATMFCVLPSSISKATAVLLPSPSCMLWRVLQLEYAYSIWWSPTSRVYDVTRF